jgi:mono/diheme cytochrome c family protein
MAEETDGKKKRLGWALGIALAAVVPATLSVLFWRTTPVAGGWAGLGAQAEGGAARGRYGKESPVGSGQAALSPEEVYRGSCARCHGAGLEGTGAVPALKRPNWPYAHNRDLLVRIIHQGRGLAMPGYEGKLSNRQIEALADWLQAANGVEP